MGKEQENPRRKSKKIYIWKVITLEKVFRTEMDKLHIAENELEKLQDKHKGLSGE